MEKDENTSELDIIKELGESGKVELDQPEDLEDPNAPNIPGAADQPAKTGNHFICQFRKKNRKKSTQNLKFIFSLVYVPFFINSV